MRRSKVAQPPARQYWLHNASVTGQRAQRRVLCITRAGIILWLRAAIWVPLSK
jgi:hypothetical protein